MQIGTSISVSGARAPGPSLDLLFAGANSLDPRISFSRASIGTRVNASGIIETIAAGLPRFDYDPVTLLPRGLLVEEPRTNLLLNSTIDGANLGTQSVTVSATPYTLSFYGTGTVTLSGAATGTITGTGAYPSRKIYTFTPAAGSLTLTVSGAVQFSNLEAGSFPTSYIPTAGAAVTRAADVATVTDMGWFKASTGTLVMQTSVSPNTSAYNRYLALRDTTGVGSNSISFYAASTAGQIGANLYSGSVSQFDMATANGAGKTLKAAISFTSGQIAYAMNGALISSQASGSVPVGINEMDIGQYAGTSANAAIASIKFYPRTFSAAELQAATT